MELRAAGPAPASTPSSGGPRSSYRNEPSAERAAELNAPPSDAAPRGPAADRGPSGSRGTDPAALLLGAIRMRALRLPLLRRAGPGPPGARAQRACRHTRAALRLRQRQRCSSGARAALAGAERGACERLMRAEGVSDAGDAGAGAGDDRRLDGVGSLRRARGRGLRGGAAAARARGVGRARVHRPARGTPGKHRWCSTTRRTASAKTAADGTGGQLRDPARRLRGRRRRGDGPTESASPTSSSRPRRPAIAEMGPNDIASARERLESVAPHRRGEFEVTSTPDWPLCHDCPARRRLCSGPAAARRARRRRRRPRRGGLDLGGQLVEPQLLEPLADRVELARAGDAHHLAAGRSRVSRRPAWPVEQSMICSRRATASS